MARRHRVLVPFEVASFLRAPYGWTLRMREAERGPRREYSRRERWAVNLGFLFLYALLVVGGVVGWLTVHTWLGVGIGVLIATSGGLVVVTAVAMPVMFVVGLVRSQRRRSR